MIREGVNFSGRCVTSPNFLSFIILRFFKSLHLCRSLPSLEETIGFFFIILLLLLLLLFLWIVLTGRPQFEKASVTSWSKQFFIFHIYVFPLDGISSAAAAREAFYRNLFLSVHVAKAIKNKRIKCYIIYGATVHNIYNLCNL